MKVLVVGALEGPLGEAAKIANLRGAKLEQAPSIDAALLVLRKDAAVSLVFCDVKLDIELLLSSLRAGRISVPIVACGIETSPAAAAAAIRAGAYDFLPLPPDPEVIAALLNVLGGYTRTLIAEDPAMLAVIQRAEQVASTEASILLSGPSGSGKEVLARHIHRLSRRWGGPFIAVNCAAIPENLLESELFGYEKGAFSGAIARRIGKFEAAHKGTLLLDEISEMDVRLQAKLLRVLQEREIDRVGGSSPVKVDVRILATTNRDLASEISLGKFREDLFFRLNVVSIHIPPLNERRADIPVLADYFANHFALLNGLPKRGFTPPALQALANGDWRGNVRELENIIHRAVLLASGDMIDRDVIELPPKGPRLAAMAKNADGAASPIKELVGRRMDDVERDLILTTLTHTAGNRTHAATILGISIRALRNKLHDYAAQGALVHPPSVGVAA